MNCIWIGKTPGTVIFMVRSGQKWFSKPNIFQKMRMLGPENHFRALPFIKMTVPGVFPINIQFIKLYKSCKFMQTGLWKVGRHIVYHKHTFSWLQIFTNESNINVNTNIKQLYRDCLLQSGIKLINYKIDKLRKFATSFIII